jgi:hypothetical protein
MNKKDQVVEVLNNARSLIEPRGKWIKGAEAKTHAGRIVGATDQKACKFCAIGALNAAGTYTDMHTMSAAQDFLDVAMVTDISWDDIEQVNDRSTTKQLHVLMAYDFAILMAEDDLRKKTKRGTRAS